MKLFLDENLSDRIVPRIIDLFRDSTHVKTVGLGRTDDDIVWDWAKQRELAIASKDSDSYQRRILRGHLPKFVYLQVGNCPTVTVITLLRSRSPEIRKYFGGRR